MLLTAETFHRAARIAWKAGKTLRTFANGVDVTDRCYSADDHGGWALCYRLNEQGRKYYDLERRGAAMEILTGDVEFVCVEPQS